MHVLGEGPTQSEYGSCVKAKGTAEMGKHIESSPWDTGELSSQVTTESVVLQSRRQDPH